MKKTLSLFLIFCLLLPDIALADVQGQVNAPAHVQETLASKTGKTTIEINADVSVPQADRVPIYQVHPRIFTQKEALAIGKAAFGSRAYIGSEKMQHAHRGIDKFSSYEHDEYSMNLNSVSTVTLPSGPYPQYSYIVNMTTLPDGSVEWANAKFDRRQVQGQPYYWIENTFQIRTDDVPAHGCSITYEQARHIADTAVASFAPDFACRVQGIVAGEIMGAETNNGDLVMSNEQEAWCFFYTRDNLELPVTFEYTTPNDPYYNVSDHERISVIVNDEGIISLEYSHPHEIKGILQADCTLLPFESILQIARTTLPLKYAPYEKMRGSVHYAVSKITLGYMRVRSMNAPDTYELIPVWDFFEGEFDSLLTVNAIDGTIIDRDYGY